MINYDFAADGAPDTTNFDWALVYEGGTTFYVGGFDSATDLEYALRSKKGVAGTFDPTEERVFTTYPRMTHIALVDLRQAAG